MFRLIVLAGLGVLVFRWMTGRWPWQPKVSIRSQAIIRAYRLLGIEPGANRSDIIAAHKRLVAMVHPDRGGSNEQVHEANAARDLLLDELPREVR
ncbi:molecular chaperone DnaJ [Aurantiacibacter atlanticus]|uniref:Molecular chaperone DnaJ n=1 Tax=Aurantiacibacter atlanticus TaxID=1648404 RepID=A0A0H4VVV3_9SPHN|nr:DnaJ domain-containing protein [Aurantiacibacter atlanticus]AKQ41178.1 molecular chaperone DnaJ [Aurantiacibacter atlanticus]MDF1835220.1 DnaJ domain-containing protein [Alteraurantiacibacter sp. bin_em_oilr2.035]